LIYLLWLVLRRIASVLLFHTAATFPFHLCRVLSSHDRLIRSLLGFLDLFLIGHGVPA